MLKVCLAVALTFSSFRAYGQILVDEGASNAEGMPMGQKDSPSQSDGALQVEKVEDRPAVGRKAASEYFKRREEQKSTSSEPARGPSSVSSSDRVLMLHAGSFLNDKAYRWGSRPKVEDPGGGMLGVTYRVGEWKSSMDLFFRAELISYDIENEHPLKLSVMPIVAFPDARSSFPLYFGAGLGAGIFFRQVGDESDLSLDYSLVVGARFPELFETTGLFFETGLKGHVHILSSGQQDGVYLAGGAIFSF